MQTEVVTYGEGGFDPTKPDGNVIARELVEVPDAEPSPDTSIDLDPVRAKVAKITNVATRDAMLALLDALATTG